eukprot:m.355897 g.355897  ORF g.355897 m.355897 type:complete len:79 (-) comp17380_c0_seq1:76-312(-)
MVNKLHQGLLPSKELYCFFIQDSCLAPTLNTISLSFSASILYVVARKSTHTHHTGNMLECVLQVPLHSPENVTCYHTP